VDHPGSNPRNGAKVGYIDAIPYISETPMTMENQNNPTTVNRTQYVLTNLGGVKNPLEFKTAEKLALKRLTELAKVVQGVSSKWFKSRSDLEYLAQIQQEVDTIKIALEAKRGKFGVI
jgi:hypothetical protein